MEGEDCEQSMKLLCTIGFGGKVPQGLVVHPGQKHACYPLGSTVVVRDLETGNQSFLHGHTNTLSCLAISKSGRYVASGQITHMGFQALIIVWDFETRQAKHSLTLHKVKVQSLSFSHDDKYLLSLGGQDDNSVVLWDLETGNPVCGAVSAMKSAGAALTCAYCNTNNLSFVTGGNQTLRVWTIDLNSKKMTPVDCQLGSLKRVVRCIEISDDDEYMYCGTTSGDLLQVNMRTKLFKCEGPRKDKYSLGIISATLKNKDYILVGCGDGTISLIKRSSMKSIRSTKVEGAVTSIVFYRPDRLFAGTAESNIYDVDMNTLETTLLKTCHYDSINDITFATGCSDLFATCSENDIRIWNTYTSSEMLRITVPNLICHSVVFGYDGRSIITGWNDGKIRCYTPRSGKLIFTINDAHNKGVTAVTGTHDCKKVLSGGGDGQVRVWDVTPKSQKMKGAMKEHKSTVNSIMVKRDDSECVTASSDGSCIVWNLRRFLRNQVLFSATMFKAVSYHPDECQIITVGSDRKIGYWEAFDGSAIRELEGSTSGSINGLDISADGEYLITGGSDKLIKVRKYCEGSVTHIGVGHSGDINTVKICPNSRFVVSVSADGAILIWEYPFSAAACEAAKMMEKAAQMESTSEEVAEETAQEEPAEELSDEIAGKDESPDNEPASVATATGEQ
eukprot:Nk52_evm71s914 gene=Nk52_evmTU71s914